MSVGGHEHRIRRLSDRLGSSLRGCSDGRPVVENRGDVAHQLPGVAGGNTGSEVLCQEQDGHSGASQDGQHDSDVVCEPPWRNCVQEVVELTKDLWSWCLCNGGESTYRRNTCRVL